MIQLDKELGLTTHWQRICNQISIALQAPTTAETFRDHMLPELMEAAGAEACVIATQKDGRWIRWSTNRQSVSKSVPKIDDTVFGHAADLDCVTRRENWSVIPVEFSSADLDSIVRGRRVIAIYVDPTSVTSQHSIDEAEALVKLLATTLVAIERDSLHQRRAIGLASVLAAAAGWQSLDDSDELLVEIARTATKVLSCQRATIFLWDRRIGKLIGRPAIGIQGGELVVSDSSGIVGEVLQTGQSKLWSRQADSANRVNQTVDRDTGFQTQSLAAVAMRDSGEKLIGVFEAINHESNQFDEINLEILQALSQHAASAIVAQGRRQRLKKSRDRLIDDAAATSVLIGQHESIDKLRTQATKVAKTELPVLILGKNGTGKEVLARQIHYQSHRRSGPFVAVNCAALVESLLESELFGHEKGAFTDAQNTRAGKFELANGGTLFLDEIGDMSLGGQSKLLRVLEEKVIVRVGGSEKIPVDVRIVAATNQPLEQLITQKKFREDLFFRLSVVSMHLPSLAERGRDALVLADHFLEHFKQQIGRPQLQFDAAARSVLASHAWPGNVRQLRNTIERVAYLSEGETITEADLEMTPAPASVQKMSVSTTDSRLNEATREFQVAHIESAIEKSKGNMTEAAGKLGLHRSNLYRKMRQLGMSGAIDESEEFTADSSSTSD
jgi:transcriptional regulator with GAF, ATPase, and Fis domain